MTMDHWVHWFWTKSAHYNADSAVYHDPPLLFDSDADPAEAHPIDIYTSAHSHQTTLVWQQRL